MDHGGVTCTRLGDVTSAVPAQGGVESGGQGGLGSALGLVLIHSTSTVLPSVRWGL